MLLSGSGLRLSTSELDSVHNYYEPLVMTEIAAQIPQRLEEGETIADIACVALNHLPPRYIRHNVDMAFYLAPAEREEIAEKIRKAVSKAIKIVDASKREA